MSKGLETLNKMLDARTADERDYYLFTYADQLEKELQALEIIKNCGINVYLLNKWINDDVEEYNYENISWYMCCFRKPKQEEFELLKEVLKDE